MQYLPCKRSIYNGSLWVVFGLNLLLSKSLYEALSNSKKQGAGRLGRVFLLEVEGVRSQQVFTIPDH
jgi:hypothetical protein